jgi:hypothetical protein
VVQPLGLGARSLAVCGSMGLEPAFGTGPSPSSRCGSHDRVCACSPASLSIHSPFLRLCSSRGGLRMEGRSLLGPRFHAPPRRDASVSSQPGASCPGAAPRSRWQPAPGVWSQHSQLSVLSAARAVSMARACHEEGGARVSVLLHPLQVGSAPLHWSDWSRREHRRACMQLVSRQRIEMSLSPPAASPRTAQVFLSRAQRAHSRLCWQERLARNTRPPTAGHLTIKLFGIPEGFATFLGLVVA